MSAVVRQVIVRGRVQGVGFRFWVEYEATARNLEDWVRNRRDGSVEALFVGPLDVVADMVALCRRGPTSARVENVAEQTANPDALNLRGDERFAMLPTL